MLTLFLIACQPHDRRGTGDVEAGRDYLLYGDYVGGGIPADFYFSIVGEDPSNVLERTGRAARVSRTFNLFEAANGVEVVGGITCLGCHGSMLDGTFVIGRGETLRDYSADESFLFSVARTGIQNTYGIDSPEYEAFRPWARGGQVVAPDIVAPFAGPNPAFSVERAAVAWRDPETLAWQDQPVFQVPELVMAGDVPPWWNVRKKTRLYYTAMGGGDLATLISQVSMVGLETREQFDGIADRMVDVLAYIDSLEPPPFPDPVDTALADEGRAVFEGTCSRCHGTYGDDPTYPEVVVPFAEVGTDPVYGQAFGGEFGDWLRASHMFSREDWPAEPYESDGYIAPPLDGVWATGPYLHNGSVPDLHTLLDSTTRPTRWKRLPGVDRERVGHAWATVSPDDDDPWIHDTTLPSFGNGGHTYGDALSAGDRTAVIEYLKTL